MYSWKVRKISQTEWHVIQTRYVGEPEFVLAKCSGPVPAGDIVLAMLVSQALRSGRDSIHNAVFGITRALEMFKAEIAVAESNGSQPHITQQPQAKT
jgi:hypothetical protein